MPSISNPELLKAAIEWKALIPRAFEKLKSLEKAIKLKIVPINSKEIVVKNISFINLTIPLPELRFNASLTRLRLLKLTLLPIAIIIPVPSEVIPKPPI